MNQRNQMKALLLAVLMLCSVLSLCACGDSTTTTGTQPPVTTAPVPTDPQDTTASYQVKVVDALGNAYTSGVVAKFLQNGEEVAMQSVNDEGIAIKKLEKGDYTVALHFTDTAHTYYYDDSDLTLSADKTALEIIVSYQMGDTKETLGVGDGEYDAYHVEVGCTYVPLQENVRNYFLFTPKRAGTYEFSVSGTVGVIGYYGSPFFVYEHNSGETSGENKFTVSISGSMIGDGDTGTTVLVLGIDAQAGDTACILNIERVGDPQKTIADIPWTIYEGTAALSPYTLPEGLTIKEFDLTASTDTYNLVYNEADGFYHLNSADGPVVLVRLGKDSRYLASYKTMLTTTRACRYFFDENGSCTSKESYTECLLEYLGEMVAAGPNTYTFVGGVIDEKNGVYPLTKDLEYIIKQNGAGSGWFDSTAAAYLFKDLDGNPIAGINNEISWLFMCCYAE